MFTANDLLQFREAQEGHMMDVCSFSVASGSIGAYGQPIIAYASGGSSMCGFNPTASREVYQPDMVAIKTDGELRLPHDTILSTHDKITITSRFGSAPDGGSASLVFGIVGEPRRGPTGLLVDLIRVQPGVNP